MNASRCIRFACAACCALVLSITASMAKADTIILKDGRQFDGTITRETPTEVTIETMISKIKAPMKFSRAEIEKIIRGDPVPKPGEPAKPDGAEKKASKPDEPKQDEDPFATEPAAASPGGTPYLVIPIRGVIGQDVIAFAIENCLKGAKSRNVKHIIFEIDSPGGMVAEALKIDELLRKNDRDFTFHALVDGGAISAATIFLADSKTIHMRPGSKAGGAVAFTRDHSTGAAEVDAKMNGIWASDLASSAERNGHPGCVFKAMVIMTERLFVWKEGDGFHFHNKEPNQEMKLAPTEIDSDKTVLTFTAADAVKWGFAKSAEGSESLGAEFGCSGWTSIGKAGERTMEQGKNSRAALLTRAEDISKEMKTLLEQLSTTAPDEKLYVTPDGKLTPQSQRAWVETMDKLMRILKTLDQRIVDSDKLDAQLKAQGAEYLTPAVHVLRDDIKIRTLIADKMEWVRKHRTRPPLK